MTYTRSRSPSPFAGNSSLPEAKCQDGDRRKAIVALAKEVKRRAAGRGGIGEFSEQHLANLANIFTKLPWNGDCQDALIVLAKELRKRASGSSGIGDFDNQHLVDFVEIV